MTNRWTFRIIRFVGILIVCGTIPFVQASEILATIQIDKAIHLLATDQTDVILVPGLYRIAPQHESALLLTAPSGSVTVISAVAVTHTVSLLTPQAVIIPENDDLLHVVLALPNGQALDAVGSLSGIRGRAAITTIDNARLKLALLPAVSAPAQQTPTVMLSPLQGPSGTMVKVTASHFPAPPSNFGTSREADVFLDQQRVQTLRLQPCSQGGIGLGPDCSTPPLTLTIDGPPGIKKTVRVETTSNWLLGTQSATGIFTVDVAPAVGQSQIAAPTLSLFPTGGAPGTLVEASACGFPATLERQLAKISVEGQVVSTAILGRCPDGSTGFGTRMTFLSGQDLLTRVTITIDGQPGPKTIQAQVDSNPAPPATTAFQINPLPPMTFAPRFQLVLGGQAVLDKETGITWERVPEVIPNSSVSFQTGRAACHRKVIGGRIGWRLPTLDELASLIDRTQRGPALAPGHPFLLPQSTSNFWTTTSDFENANSLYTLDMRDGLVTMLPKSQIASFAAWCVRGIPGPDKQ
jgi:uncharacterized protein DUF1566